MRRSFWITRGLLMTEHQHDEHPAGLGFERQDWTARPVYGFLVSLAVIGVMVYVTVWGIFKVLDRYFNEHQQLVGESDPSRTEAPETVEPASAGRTLRRISPLGADSRRLVRKGTSV